MKKAEKSNCSLCADIVSTRNRLHGLSVLEEMVANFYVPFSRQVNQSYSLQEQDALVRIIKLLGFRIKGGVSASCALSSKSVCHRFVFDGAKSYFKLALPAENPFTLEVRHCLLCELEKRLYCFFVSQNGHKPCSDEEKRIMKRVKKLLIHQLGKTPKYALFKGNRVMRLSEEELAELKKQKTDEIRMNATSLYHYNPLSQKYKKVKEKLVEEIRLKYGED